MEARFNMTIEQNIFVAKRNIVDYIWKSARLEGIGVTFPDTEAIYSGISVPDLKVNDIIAINNLKHAWHFVLQNIEYPVDYPYICKINQLVGGGNLISGAGYIRTLPVSIGGTSWKPEIPTESEIKDEIADIQKADSPTERAITLMLYGMRRQIFLDGNKRTSMLAANHIMISNGAGIISIPIEHQRQFTQLLVDYYESNEQNTLKSFVYENCIDGIPFENGARQGT